MSRTHFHSQDQPFAGSRDKMNEMDQFASCLQDLVGSLTTDYTSNQPDTPEIKASIEQTVYQLTEKARQLDNFFAWNTEVFSAAFPEQMLQGEISEIEAELVRKGELLDRETMRLSRWLDETSPDRVPAPPPAATPVKPSTPAGGRTK